MSTSSGSPSFLHDDTVSVFYEALSASLREVARIDRPETAPLLVHEGQRKLRGENIRKNAFARLRVVKNRNTSQHLWIVFGFI